MELRLHHIIYHLYNIFLENDELENCAQLLEEVNKMFGTIYINDEHDCNVVSSACAGGPPTPSSSLPYVVWADPASRRTPYHIPMTLRYKFL